MSDNNKELSRRALLMWASGNTDSPEEVFAADYVNHQESDVKGSVNDRDLADWKELVANHHKAFSNVRVQITLQLAEADLVASRFVFTAVHSAEFMGVPASGRELTWTGIEIDRVADGKILESWVDWDKYGFLQGLGLVP